MTIISPGQKARLARVAAALADLIPARLTTWIAEISRSDRPAARIRNWESFVRLCNEIVLPNDPPEKKAEALAAWVAPKPLERTYVYLTKDEVERIRKLARRTS